MNLDLTADQELLAKEARDFLEKECTPELVRQLRGSDATGHSEELWAKLADLGWLGLALPSGSGGGGATLFDLGLFYEQAGRVLLPTTLYSTVFACLVVDALGTEEQRRSFLTAVAAGDRIGTVAFAEPQAIRDMSYLRTRAHDEGDRWILNGEKAYVQNAHLADPILVVARTGRGLTVFAAPRATPGVIVEPHVTFGGDRQSRIRLEDVELSPDAVVGGSESVGAAQAPFEGALLEATALQCMEMVGGAQKVLDITVDYVKEREQFGRPIGSFQAVHHHVANLAMSVESARWTSYQAMWRVSERLPAKREVAIAKSWAGEAYKSVTVLAHQLHGGIGYVLEHNLHLWSERAKATELSFGTRDRHLKELALEVGL